MRLTDENQMVVRRWRSVSLTAMLPVAVVSGTVIFNLITLFPETTPVAYLNDSAIHSEMVRFATTQIRAGHLPLTSWFPLLGEGSPQFIHYQSLGAMITGGLGVVLGPNVAYAWMLYLLLATWPISIYLAIRLLRFDRTSAALGALFSPFVVSILGIGYEQQAYLSIGYGLWSQLFSMWTLPLAWGFTWRVASSRRAILPATVLITLTIAFHFLTGYLALMAIPIAFLASAESLRDRMRNYTRLLVFVALTSAWVILPLLHLRAFASVNEFLAHGPDVNSYGARQITDWLVTGQLFDSRRLPVLTILVLCGIVLAALRFVRDARMRNLLLLFLSSLVLFFGRTTFGSLFRLLPGNEDLFLRRFLMGVQLAGLIAAGVGTAALGRSGARALRSLHAYLGGSPDLALDESLFTRVLGGFIVALLLVPCVSSELNIDHAEASFVRYQHHADIRVGAVIAPLINTIVAKGGRVYAGLPVPGDEAGGWGSSLTVGEVPVFKYLTRFNLDVVGYTLRTASLMTDPEVYFDENVPADFPLFGVRWLIYPTDLHPPAGAVLVMRRGPYVLWRLNTSGVLEVVDTTGSIEANRTNIGRVSAAFVRSDLAATGRYLTVGFAGAPPAPPTLAPPKKPVGRAGTVTQAVVDLTNGRASATVLARRPAVVVLKASFDPGWHASVDGRPVATEMIAPAYVGVPVGPGRHVVTFVYASNADEGLLLLVLVLTTLLLIVEEVRSRQNRG